MEEMNLTLPHRGKLKPPRAPGGGGAGATEQVAVWPLGSEPGWPWLPPWPALIPGWWTPLSKLVFPLLTMEILWSAHFAGAFGRLANHVCRGPGMYSYLILLKGGQYRTHTLEHSLWGLWLFWESEESYEHWRKSRYTQNFTHGFRGFLDSWDSVD